MASQDRLDQIFKSLPGNFFIFIGGAYKISYENIKYPFRRWLFLQRGVANGI
jgi:hypothetical protein